MKRFHVYAADGRVFVGAAAFVAVWRHLPGWRWAARAASLPGALAALEQVYRSFLIVRPLLAKLVTQLLRFETSTAVGKHK